MTRDQLIPTLALVTLLMVLGWAIWSRVRTRRSQKASSDPDGSRATRQSAERPPEAGQEARRESPF